MQGGNELRLLLSTACGRSGPSADTVPDGGAAGVPDGRARDAAFNELLRLVMIFVRAGMGRRLRDRRESVDVCQSIARSFVEDFEAGKLEFESEAALAGYLRSVVRSKLVDLSRHDGREKRGGGQGGEGVRAVSLDGPAFAAAFEPAADGPSASFDVRTEEARTRILALLSADEQALLRLRWRGLSWEQIGSDLKRDSGAIRQQFSRMQKRVLGGPDNEAMK